MSMTRAPLRPSRGAPTTNAAPALQMTPGDYALTLYRGDTYRWTFILWADANKTVPVDLTNATVKAEIRDKSAGTHITSMTCTTSLPNTIHMVLDATSCKTAVNGKWDLQITDPINGVRTVLGGTVTITDDITDSS